MGVAGKGRLFGGGMFVFGESVPGSVSMAVGVEIVVVHGGGM